MTDPWRLVYESFEPGHEGVREALCTLGNGHFCTRGALVTSQADEIHYPGTYLAGGYNRLNTEVAGRVIENEDLVNFPNWLHVTFRPVDGAWFNLQGVDLLEFRQELDLRVGVLTTDLRYRDRQGRTSRLTARRLASMANPHLAAVEMSLLAEDWDGEIEIVSTLDGRIINAGVKRYRDLSSTHLTPLEADAFEIGDQEQGLKLVVETNQSHLRLAEAARTRVSLGGQARAGGGEILTKPGYVAHVFKIGVRRGEAVTVEKMVGLHSGRDHAISEPGLAACDQVIRAGGFDAVLADHAAAWSRLWNRFDIRLEGPPDIEMYVRLHIFHLLQTLSPNSIDRDIGVPARGWHGEAYRGHVFWDEMYILPFINLRLPALSRSMLDYRYRRLDAARRAARDAGFDGAMFPWQSGSDGREESQVMHLNPRSGRWHPDNTYLQRHVGLAIAHNVWMYYLATGDRHFMEVHGADMILSIAQFFVSLTTHNPATGRWEIRRVMGPDEYHDAYPDADTPGLNNNAYTNVMVSWLLGVARQIYFELDHQHRSELLERLDLDEDALVRWEEISRGLVVPFHDDGVISQFEGYEDLAEFDWAGYRERYGDIQRLDRILEAEGDSPNRYKLSKQADVLMLFYLFSQHELSRILGQMGYNFTPEQWERTVHYYMERTSHGSTLSYVVHSWVLARTHPELAWENFTHALQADVADIQGGTTAEGIHLGAMAGTVDLVQRCFTGLELRLDGLHLDPNLPRALDKAVLKVRYLGHWLTLTVTRDHLVIEAHPGWPAPVPVSVRGHRHMLDPGGRFSFDLG